MSRGWVRCSACTEAPALSASVCWRGKSSGLTGPAEGLRKVLALERQRKFANTAVIGGLDAYLLHFVREAGIPSTHRLSRILQSLPVGGYRALHPVQRSRVVEELLNAVDSGLPSSPAGDRLQAASPQPAPITLVHAATPRRTQAAAKTI